MKKINNKNRYAVWIDHRKAIMLCADAEGNLTEEIMNSPIGSNERFNGEETSKTSFIWPYTNPRNTSAA